MSRSASLPLTCRWSVMLVEPDCFGEVDRLDTKNGRREPQVSSTAPPLAANTGQVHPIALA